jgi:hypothetical protein
MAFEGMRHWFRLNQLQREKRSIRFSFAVLERKAIEEKDVEKLNDITDKEIRALVTIDEKISRLQTEFLRDEAQRLELIVPQFDTSESGLWKQALTAPTYHLKHEAIVELRSAVRKEKKERREVWQAWAALTIGVLGALIGLVAALKNRPEISN